MLPVPHQACTLATGALRSSLTISVKPSGRTHFFAVFGGKVISAESFIGAAFKLTMVKKSEKPNPAALMGYTIYCLFNFQSAGPFDQETFGAGKPGRDSSFFSGA